MFFQYTALQGYSLHKEKTLGGEEVYQAIKGVRSTGFTFCCEQQHIRCATEPALWVW